MMLVTNSSMDNHNKIDIQSLNEYNRVTQVLTFTTEEGGELG